MRSVMRSAAVMAGLVASAAAYASEAATSATAGSGYGRNGNASATARYEGKLGWARTDTHSGPVNLARGVAVGVDEDGISVSVSNAIAPNRGPALATTFNLSIGRDGDVSHSRGISVADGPFEREATAGGSTAAERGRTTSTALAGGRTDRFGRVVAHSSSEDHVSPRRVIVAERRGPREVVRVRGYR